MKIDDTVGPQPDTMEMARIIKHAIEAGYAPLYTQIRGVKDRTSETERGERADIRVVRTMIDMPDGYPGAVVFSLADEAWYYWGVGASAWAEGTGGGGTGDGDMLRSVYDIDMNGIVDAAESVPWSGVSDKPSTFPSEPHGHDWSEVGGKPSTYPPSAHDHAWTEITDKPAAFPPESHNHSWSNLTDPPATYAPSAHGHAWSEISDQPAIPSATTDLSDVSVVTPAEGQILIYQSSKWTPGDYEPAENVPVQMADLSALCDDIETTFSLPSPYVPGSTRVYLNGLLQRAGRDYSEVLPDGIEMATAPEAGDDLIVVHSEFDASPPAPLVLDDISNVNASAPGDGQVLAWNDTAQEWQPATVSAAAQETVFTFVVTDALAVGASPIRLHAPRACTIGNIVATVGSVPSGASVILDVNRNGTTVFTTQANRPEIAIGDNDDLSATPDVTAIAQNDVITLDVDQVGSGDPGSNLVVQVRCA